MAYEVPVLSISLEASADLSSSQFLGIKVNSSGQAALVAASTDKGVGVLQNKPGSGKTAQVMVSGVTKAKAGGTVTVGGVAMFNSSGQVVNATATNQGIGIFLTGGGSGEIVTVLLRDFGTQ